MRLSVIIRPMNELSVFGWTAEHEQNWQAVHLPGTVPGRVIADFGTSFRVVIPSVITAELSGKLAHHSSGLSTPKIGDWVEVRMYDHGKPIIKSVLLRKNEIARNTAGNQTKKQVIATNIDVAFVVLALDNDFSVDRVRRFLYQLSINAIKPIIVLNKVDKTPHPERYVEQLKSFKLTVLLTAASEGRGIDEIIHHIEPGETAILLGSSGVGKSTITNQLLGHIVQRTQPIKESDDTGKHTTVHRELFTLPHGGLLIDTPGIRELQLWGTDKDLTNNFRDIAELITNCDFSSCQHNKEYGCAIQAALNDGSLARPHYEAYLQMKEELALLKVRTIARAKYDNRQSKIVKKKRLKNELDEFRREQ